MYIGKYKEKKPMISLFDSRIFFQISTTDDNNNKICKKLF